MSGRAATDRVIRGRAAVSVNDPGHPTPLGWSRVALTDVADLGTGHTPSRHKPEYWNGDIGWIGIRDAGAHHGGVIHETNQTITPLGVENSAARLLPKDTICLSRTASVGYVVKMGAPMTTSQDFVTWSCTEALEPDYLLQALLAEGNEIRRFGEGSTHTTIYFPAVKAFTIDLPPLAEQRRIVTKLESLTACLARARAEIDRVPVLARQLRQRALSEAVLGLLVVAQDEPAWDTADYNAIVERRSTYIANRRGSRLRSDLSCSVARLAGNQSGWLDCRLSDLVSLRVGYAFKSSNFVTGDGVPLLRGANVAPGRIDWSDRACVSTCVAENYSNYELSSGDIVIAMDRTIISSGLKVAQIDDESAGSLLVQRVANPQPSRWILSKYLMILLKSPLFTTQIEAYSTGSDLPHISANDILTTPAPLPPLSLQQKIADAVDAILARADRLEAEAVRARRLLDRLEATIRAKAFRGELVPQDPNDEPASALLDRIRAERAAAPKPKRGRARKAVG